MDQHRLRYPQVSLPKGFGYISRITPTRTQNIQNHFESRELSPYYGANAVSSLSLEEIDRLINSNVATHLEIPQNNATISPRDTLSEFLVEQQVLPPVTQHGRSTNPYDISNTFVATASYELSTLDFNDINGIEEQTVPESISDDVYATCYQLVFNSRGMTDRNEEQLCSAVTIYNVQVLNHLGLQNQEQINQHMRHVMLEKWREMMILLRQGYLEIDLFVDQQLSILGNSDPNTLLARRRIIEERVSLCRHERKMDIESALENYLIQQEQLIVYFQQLLHSHVKPPTPSAVINFPYSAHKKPTLLTTVPSLIPRSMLITSTKQQVEEEKKKSKKKQDKGVKKKKKKPKNRALPTSATKIMKKWFNDHIENPYPTVKEKEELVALTGLNLQQVNNWFINKRGRAWKKNKPISETPSDTTVKTKD